MTYEVANKMRNEKKKIEKKKMKHKIYDMMMLC